MPRKIKIKVKADLDTVGNLFVVAFMVFLISAAILLALNNEAQANKLAEYAYYSLVIAVVIKIADYIKYSRKQSS